MKLLLVCGGQSTEHAVSRMSCVNIYKNCDKSKYDIKVDVALKVTLQK